MATKPADFHGVVCVDKPAGWTSFDVVAKLRGILGQRQLGHGGTLDPMATGVLPVFCGAATKVLCFLPDGQKCYEAKLLFGKQSDTLDVTGKVCDAPAPTFDQSTLEAALQTFMGESMQLPPMFSAVQVGGKRLYDLARAGICVERTPRPITIYELTLLDFDATQYTATLRMRCSAGTYVRALADDLGKALGTGCILTHLNRTVALGFALADCCSLEALEQAAKENRLTDFIKPITPAFAERKGLWLTPKQAKAFCLGQKLSPAPQGVVPSAPLKALEASDIPFPVWAEDKLLGMGLLQDNTLRARRVFQQALR